MIQKTIEISKAYDASLTVYLHSESSEMNTGKRPGILIFPGGGYSMCSDREAEPVALEYLSEGYQAFILRYSVGEFRNFERALEQAARSLEILHEHGDHWNLDTSKIAVIGFSAGGHLAAAVSNLSPIKPALCMLGYPVILKPFATAMKIESPSLDECVTADTPPTFLFSTFSDNLVPIEHSLAYLRALEAHDVPFESHIFQTGKHGLSVAKSYTANGQAENVNAFFRQWVPLSKDWLKIHWGDFPLQHIAEMAEEPSLRMYFKDENKKQLLLTALPMLNDPENYKLLRNFSLNVLHERLPDIFTAQLTEHLINALKSE